MGHLNTAQRNLAGARNTLDQLAVHIAEVRQAIDDTDWGIATNHANDLHKLTGDLARYLDRVNIVTQVTHPSGM